MREGGTMRPFVQAGAGLKLIWCKRIDHIYMIYMRLFVLIGL